MYRIRCRKINAEFEDKVKSKECKVNEKELLEE